MSNCLCKHVMFTMSGGVKVGGVADFKSTSIGGVKVGGKAEIDGSHVYFGLAAIYPLIEDESPYLDRGMHELDGVGVNSPALDGCFQIFKEDEFGVGKMIELEPDFIAADQPYSMSCWLQIDELYKQRTIYSRGVEGESGKWVFALSYSILNHVIASIRYEDGTFIDCFSDITLQQHLSYHVAVNVGKTKCQIFIDGVLQGTTDLPAGDRAILWNSCFFGGLNRTGFGTFKLSEFRLYPRTNDVHWWKLEYDNICGGIYTIEDA